MKQIFTLSLLLLILASCGESKKAIEQAKIKEEQAIAIKIEKEQKLLEERKKAQQLKEQKRQEAIAILKEKEEKKKELIEKQKELEKEILTEVFDHGLWNKLLNTHVSKEGNVNYEGFKTSKSELKAYLTSLDKNTPLNSWSQEDKLAYWMNAYNAMTIDLILRNFPLNSIKDIDKPWDQRLWKLGGKWYNLNEIEHQILRKMGDARIHFGINCASFSCPPLLNEAFTSNSVDTQLAKLAKQFVNDTKRNTITSSKIEISKIFNWFSKDFKKEGSLIDFLNKYSETPINNNARKSYKDYNWSLNK